MQPLPYEGQPRLGLEGIPFPERQMQPVHALAQRGIGQQRGVDGGSGQPLRQHRGVQVQHTLAEARLGHGPSVVDHAGRQQDHLVRHPGAVPFPVEGEVHPPAVHDHQRPGVVHMGRVRVLGEPGVEDLGDTRHRWLPGGDGAARSYRGHVRNVQDRPRAGREAVRMTPHKINIARKLAGFTEQWAPRRIARVNDHEVRLARLQGEFVWHTHEDTDELFLVVGGTLTIRLRDGDVVLGPGEMYVVPRGVEHCPAADEEAQILLFEPAGTVNTGSAGGGRTREPVDAQGSGLG